MENKNKIINKKEQIKASIIGFIVGDAIGVPVEFVSRNELKNNPITTMEEYGTHYQPKGTWSDDTSMVLASMSAIINNQFSDSPEEIAKSMAEEFVNWYDNGEYTPFGKVFDIGGTTLGAISEFKRNRDILNCGMKSESENGNGSLMRILPAIFYGLSKYKEEKEFNDFIFMISSLTHAHAYSKISCLIYAKYIEFLLEYSDKQEAYLKLKEWFEEPVKSNPKYSFEDIKPFDRILKKDISKLKDKDIKSSGFVLDTLEAVLWSVLTTNSYKEAVLCAVNLGDDTDTIGALTGGLVGIIYGYDAIPSEWIDAIQRKEYIMELINQFNNNLEKSNDFDIELLNDTIEHLTSDPNACTLYDVKNPKEGVITIPESNPSEQLLKFIKYLYDANKIDLEYAKKEIKELQISDMKYDDVITRLTSIIRGDRFCSGLLHSCVQSGEFLDLLIRLKEILMNKEGEKMEDNDLDKIVDIVVEKIEEMEDGARSSIYNLVDEKDKKNIDLFKIQKKVQEKLKKRNIKLDYSQYNGMYVGVPYALEFIKRGKKKENLTINNNYMLKVEHVPFHNAYGIISELKTPEPILKEISLEVNKVMDLGGITLKVLEINDKFVKLLLPSGLGVYCDYEIYKQGKEENIILNLNEKKKINKDVFDCMEWWDISLINTSITSSDNNQKTDNKIEITKLDFPKVKGEINEYYIDKNDREINRIKEIELLDILPTEISEYEKIDIDQPIIMFKIISGNVAYQLHFGYHDDKGWLDFSYNDNPQDQYFCTLSKLMFNDFREQVTKLTSNWKRKYVGENKVKTKWYLKEISGNKLTKNFEGENDYPDNWNEFLDFMIFYEKICKIYSKKS